MPKLAMKPACKREGYCCPFALLKDKRSLRTGELTSFLGISRRALQYWRRRFKNGKLACAERAECLKARGLL